MDVLIPRPETELLVENAFEILKEVKNQEKSIKVLEIGTGSGIISVMLATLLKDKNIDFIAVDINPKAIELARKMQKNLKF